MSATIIPGLRYHDAPAAVEFLCRAFGFEKGLVVPGPNDTIAHAQLVRGNAMIMLGSAVDDDFSPWIGTARELGKCSQSAYVVVEDADAHHAAATSAGATVIRELSDEDYGGRGYSCLDLEGNVWHFGTYDPWA